MPSKVRRRCRDTSASQVIRAGAQDSKGGAELAGDQCRVGKNSGAEGKVDPVPDQIERFVREKQLDLGFRMSGEKNEQREPAGISGGFQRCLISPESSICVNRQDVSEDGG